MRYLIVDTVMGIYLGSCMGFGFWSKLDPAGQDAAVSFESIADAEAFMATWESGRRGGVRFAPVEPDDGIYATVAACVRAGLEGWLDEVSPAVSSSVN